MKARPLLIAGFLAAATLVALAQQTIVVSTTAGTIRGTVRDAQAATGPALVAVVFPVDATKWTAPDAAQTIKRADVVSGRFAFENLPAGVYRLGFATESGLTGWPDVSVLGRLARQPGMSIPVAVGEQINIDAAAIRIGTDVSIQDVSVSRLRMLTGDIRTILEFPPVPGAISGRVIDAFGKPVAGAEVRALPWTLGGGVSRGAGFGPLVVTDADGHYLIPSQQPGAYLVSVPSFTSDRQSLLSTSVRRVPPAAVGNDGNRRGYVNTYYPNVVDAGAAKVVYVTTSERNGVDIQLASRAVFDVTGRVVGDLPASAAPIMTVTYVRGDARTAFGEPRRVKVSPDGAFAIEELPDGDYALDMILATGFVQSRVVIAGRAVPPLAVVLQAFTLAAGRAEFRGQSPPAAAMRGLVYLSPVTPRDDGLYTSTLQADGTFAAQGVGPGPYRLRASASAPWVQVAGMINGIDTLDLPALLDTNVSDAFVVFTDRESRVTVEVRNDRGEVAGEAGVLVFSDDQRYWVTSSRRVQLSETSVDGKCLLTDMPPGKYFAVAGQDFRMGRAITPGFVGALKNRAVAFELGAGESRVVQVVVR